MGNNKISNSLTNGTHVARWLSAVAPMLLLGTCENAGTTTADIDIEALSSGDGKAVVNHFDAQLGAFVREEDIPSMSAAIVRSTGTVAYFSFGTLDRGQDTRITENTVFQIASLSKLLTGIVTNSLFRSGAIDPDAPVSTYLGPVLGKPVNGRLESTTTRQLLHHRAGVANEDCSLYAKRADGEPWLDGYSRAELIADLKVLSPREQGPFDFGYSSCGYAIVGLIDEAVSDEPFAALLDDQVTAQYGMADTVVALDADQRSRLATPYRKDDRRIQTQASDMGMGTPGSAIYSTTRDLAKLQAAQLMAYRSYLAGGDDSDLILSRQTEAGQEANIRFGTGIIEFRHEQGTVYLHDGDADGYASFYAFAPDQDVGIVMLTGSGGDYFVDAGIELLTLLMAAENKVSEDQVIPDGHPE